MQPGQPDNVRDDKRRGNRPVGFYFDQSQHQQFLRQQTATQTEGRARSCGLLRTNRLFYYGTLGGQADMHKLLLTYTHMAYASHVLHKSPVGSWKQLCVFAW